MAEIGMNSPTNRLIGDTPRIGIRPTIDGRRKGVRESLEEQTMDMAQAAARFLYENLRHPSGLPVECVIADTCIGGVAEAAQCAEKFAGEGVGAQAEGLPRVGHHEHRRVAGQVDLALDHRRRGPRLQRGLDEPVPVHPRARQGHEQVARADAPRIVDGTLDLDLARPAKAGAGNPLGQVRQVHGVRVSFTAFPVGRRVAMPTTVSQLA